MSDAVAVPAKLLLALVLVCVPVVVVLVLLSWLPATTQATSLTDWIMGSTSTASTM